MTERQKWYREVYLKSDHWKKLRAEKLGGHRKRCGVCGNPKVQIHHLTYRNIYDVTASDLRRLCDDCHKAFHEAERAGDVKITSCNHHGRWSQTKAAIIKHRGLKGNQFWSK